MTIFSVRFQGEDAQALQELAAHEERTRGDVIRRLVRRAHRELQSSTAGPSEGVSPAPTETGFRATYPARQLDELLAP